MPGALVTGGSKGLGAEIVRELARDGHDVVFTYLDDSDSAASVVQEVEAMGRTSTAIQADAGIFDRAEEVVDEAKEFLGDLSILVCNAGFARKGMLWELTEADWDDVMNVCLKGTFNYIRAVAPLFREQERGKIVAIGSINGIRPRAGTASYNAAKAGLTGLIKAAAIEMGDCNVNVNLVAPGFIETPSQEQTPDSVRKKVLDECMIKRLGTPEDIAPIVAFLCGEGARHITGQVITADAGQYH